VIAADLIADLARRGITLQARGDRLRYSPRSAVTPDLADRMKAHKAELLAVLCGGADAPDDRQFDNWTELHRPDGGLSWIHPNHADNDFHAIDLPDPCPTCGTFELWQTLVGNWRCLRCDPPTCAWRLMDLANRLRSHTATRLLTDSPPT